MSNHEDQYRAVRCSQMLPSSPGDGRVALYFEGAGGSREILIEESLRLERRSPTGFEFGYLGSGPMQLSFAVLWDMTGDKELARRLMYDFQSQLVKSHDGQEVVLLKKSITRWIADKGEYFH